MSETPILMTGAASSYEALACDYDGTIARDGAVAEPTLVALQKLKASGTRLLLVTGRRVEDLLQIFGETNIFERVVAENGGVLYRPDTSECLPLSRPPPAKLIELLRHRGVVPLELGHVIVATREPQETIVLEAIRQLGLELQLIFNKGAVMILPSGVNKATGLKRALKELSLLPKQVVGIGDAENDHAFLDLCGFSVAVANALPALREHSDWVTPSPNGAGVAELVQAMLDGSLRAPRQTSTDRSVVLRG